MDFRTTRSWMYNRLCPGRKGLTEEFLSGVEFFINYVSQNPLLASESTMRCPCVKHKNCAFLTHDEVRVDLYRKGFMPNYWIWTSHGEYLPEVDHPYSSSHGASTSHTSTSYVTHGADDRTEEMVFNAFQPNVDSEEREHAPNSEAQNFYDLLESAQQPLWPGCTSHSELSTAVRLLSIKSEFNMQRECFNQVSSLMKETNPPDNLVPQDYYRAKKLFAKLGLKALKIDCCMNGCMLYYKEDSELMECKYCEAPRFKESSRRQRKNIKQTPNKRLIYLPLIPRLQRLFASMSSAGHMTWHYKPKVDENVITHPSEAEAWKHFDRCYPDFAAEPRNIRLGLCTDGFTPYSQAAAPYSCWPVIITPYNLPPDLCMTSPYLFLSLIIPGPKNPKAKLDVYLQPLIDDLKLLWQGVQTYDIATKQNFLMRAALMWTIGDFPAYGMLSGWSTAGKLACPYCMDESKAFTLKHGRKNTWFDSHRTFLPPNHIFRRNKDAFIKNKIVKDNPPQRPTGDQLWEIMKDIPTITEMPYLADQRMEGYGVNHNWIKRSIFWDLPYWKSNLIRHNLDVMHIEKNFFDNIFNTLMDVKGKTKDNLKARMDLKEICRRKELELIEAGEKLLKPKATYVLSLEQRRIVCEWVQNLKMPDGYASNLARCVDNNSGRMIGMKSHDCHIFMECLLPIAFISLPEAVWNAITEVSIFFKDLCSTRLLRDSLLLAEQNIPVTICKLERIFPPGFFDSMEHLPIHLPYEARVGGPVQYRWMYPFERFLNKIKHTVKNKAHPEGSICEAYLVQETSHFCSYYFGPNIDSARTRIARNEDIACGDLPQCTLSIFQSNGRATGKSTRRYLTDRELKAARLYVLLNCDEIQPFLELFTSTIDSESEVVIDKKIEEEFPTWFKNYMHNYPNQIDNQELKDLAWGPLRSVLTWPIFIVNGFRFHIKSLCEGRKTDNSGVYVKGNTHSSSEGDYYGVLQEVIQLFYPGDIERSLFLFNCEWFDPILNRGTRVHSRYKLVEVKKSKRYTKYDPFIIANQAHQCYYVSYPTKVRDKVEWYAVIKTKPRAVVDIKNIIETAHQEDEMSGFNPSQAEVEQLASLIDENVIYEEHVTVDLEDATDHNVDEEEDEEIEIDTDDTNDDTSEHTTDFLQDGSDE